MKNTKGLLALAVATAIILVGCGGEPAQPKEDVPKEIPDEVVIFDDKFTPTDDNLVVRVDDKVYFTHDNFIVHSNYNLNLDYMPYQSVIQMDRFEHVKTYEEAVAVEKAMRKLQSSLISEISNVLTKNPHEVSDNQHVNALQKGSSTEYTPTRELVTYHDLTSLFIIDKFDDAYMNEHHAIEGVTDFMVQLDAYEENLKNAESVEEIIVTLFENDQFVVKLSPSDLSLNSYGDFNNAQALSLLDEYVDYFKTPKVKSLIEDALGQKF